MVLIGRATSGPSVSAGAGVRSTVILERGQPSSGERHVDLRRPSLGGHDGTLGPSRSGISDGAPARPSWSRSGGGLRDLRGRRRGRARRLRGGRDVLAAGGGRRCSPWPNRVGGRPLPMGRHRPAAGPHRARQPATPSTAWSAGLPGRRPTPQAGSPRRRDVRMSRDASPPAPPARLGRGRSTLALHYGLDAAGLERDRSAVNVSDLPVPVGRRFPSLPARLRRAGGRRRPSGAGGHPVPERRARPAHEPGVGGGRAHTIFRRAAPDRRASCSTRPSPISSATAAGGRWWNWRPPDGSARHPPVDGRGVHPRHGVQRRHPRRASPAPAGSGCRADDGAPRHAPQRRRAADPRPGRNASRRRGASPRSERQLSKSIAR